MARIDIIDRIGRNYITSNLEKDGEFSYVKAGIPLSSISKNEQGLQNYKLDTRFENKGTKLSILVETINVNPSKKSVLEHEKKLLEGYCVLETRYRPEHNIILILAHSGSVNKIKVWKKIVGSEIELLTDTKIKTFKEYEKYFVKEFVNNEIKLKISVLELNTLLHKNSIGTDIRGQFVGTCLLALKSANFIYKAENNITLDTSLIIQGIKTEIGKLLYNDVNRANKIALLDTEVLNDQHVRSLKKEKFCEILDFISNEIIPHINVNTSKGQDLLNLFFTTFNKYVGKKDKNQAFTPDHITHFMCKVAGVNKNSRVLDPTCGSGSFIVQALIQELYECDSDYERDKVRKENIYGIENEEKAFGLSTTNMLIHGDGNSNIIYEENLDALACRIGLETKILILSL